MDTEQLERIKKTFKDYYNHGKCLLTNYECIHAEEKESYYSKRAPNCDWCRRRCKYVIPDKDKHCESCAKKFICWTE
jgi:hypothetical protein